MERWIFIAGLLHIVILTAALHVPFVLQWNKHLATLPVLLRRLMWVYGSFITLIIVSFGVLSITLAEELASGTPLARGVCAMMATFWLARFPLEWLVFPDLRPYMTHPYMRVGHWLLTATFAFAGCVYATAAVMVID